MIGAETTELIWQAVRILALIAFPMVAAVSVAGLLVGAFQAITSIQDPASGFAVRLAALFVVIYLLWPTWNSMIYGFALSIFAAR